LVSFVLLAALLLVSGVAGAEEIKVATRNIEHLRDEVGEGPNARGEEVLCATEEIRGDFGCGYG
jgi:hypothetical protein